MAYDNPVCNPNNNLKYPDDDSTVNVEVHDDHMTRKNNKKKRSTPWSIGCKAWCLKYFLEGQALEKDHKEAVLNLPTDAPLQQKLLIKHRRFVAIIIPAAFFHFCWWGIFIQHDLWHLFEDKYFMSITMIFGSLIAGMTSEGGGAIAFPVMTLAFDIAPSVARDFSLMIQSCGMTAAAFSIFFMKVQLEWNSLVFCSLGGLFGTIFGLHVVDPALTPPQKKMGFVSIWFSFAFALFLLNRMHKRNTFTHIPEMKLWKVCVLIAIGFVGGICTAFSGSGLDICSFSILTLLFRVSEKTATPTSVILMAGNTCVGFYWRQVMLNEVSTDAWEFLGVCVPIVVIGAPMGSLIGTHFHRQVLASLIYVIDTAALIGAFILVKLTTWLIVASCLIIAGGFIFFGIVAYLGQKMMGRIIQRQEKRNDKLNLATVDLPNPVSNAHDVQLCWNCKGMLRKITPDDKNNNTNQYGYENDIYSTHL